MDPGLIETWFDSCLRSVANYNRYLIWGGVNAAAIVKREGMDAFVRAVETTAEPFMWDVSKEFFASVLPAAGFEDIGDLMELGMRGMYADQWFMRGEERQEEGETAEPRGDEHHPDPLGDEHQSETQHDSADDRFRREPRDDRHRS